MIDAQSSGSDRFDITETIENGEGIVALENLGPVIYPRRSGEDVKTVLDADNLPAHGVSETILPSRTSSTSFSYTFT